MLGSFPLLFAARVPSKKTNRITKKPDKASPPAQALEPAARDDSSHSATLTLRRLQKHLQLELSPSQKFMSSSSAVKPAPRVVPAQQPPSNSNPGTTINSSNEFKSHLTIPDNRATIAVSPPGDAVVLKNCKSGDRNNVDDRKMMKDNPSTLFYDSKDPGRLEQRKRMIDAVRYIYTEIAKMGDRSGNKTISYFHAEKIPSLSIGDYLQRIEKYSEVSDEACILSLIYIDRMIQQHPGIFNSFSAHRFMLTSIMVAAKFFDDRYFNNNFFARVGGIPTRELNALEVEFLTGINFSLYVDTGTYAAYAAKIQEYFSQANSDNECHKKIGF